jgi:non-homologous end joining protein Ku
MTEALWQECVDVALEIAEELLMDAPNYSPDDRIVPTDKLLRIVQELNAALKAGEPSEAEAARYRAALNEELEARAVSYRLNPAGRPPAVEPETIDLMVALKESIDAERELGE